MAEGGRVLSSEVLALLSGTLDAALLMDGTGRILRSNHAAERLLGIGPQEILGRPCEQLLRGTLEGGEPVCARNCVVLERAAAGHPTEAFDCEISAASGRRWVNMSCLTLTTRSRQTLLLHLIRDIDTRKRLESVTKRFLEQIAGLTGERMEALLSAPHPRLAISTREHDVLELMVEGLNTQEMASRLGISVSTVRNHVNRLLRKLMVHDRTHAVLRAVRERLL